MAEVVLRYYDQHGQHTPARKWLKFAVNHWVLFYGAASVDEVCKPTSIQRFIDHLRSQGRKPSYIQNILTAGKAALSRAYKLGEITRKPHIPSIKVGQTQPKGRPCSPEELAAYLDAAPAHLRPLIFICIGTASRPQAVTQLTWSQIDFGDNLLHLNQEGREQTSKHRPTVKLPPTLRDYLKAQLRTCEYVVHFRGKPVHRYQESLQRNREVAELDSRINMYSPRHSAARWMRKLGVPPWEISAQLGHKMARGMDMTELYAAYSPDYQAKATAALDGLLRAVLAASSTISVHPS
ncbi:tyrosine-type recombinase/integrase [Methylobacterium sp. Leaf118]|uniref:tyrosine-type recombinase/integrase n=1 Tax=Methylobacterium sp. Leaf118 TaxID=2876562 RepID=UPI001E2DD4B3|nr:tyrosine-type recombinase/integrase [Methylobacterium sp. Leaf118]